MIRNRIEAVMWPVSIAVSHRLRQLIFRRARAISMTDKGLKLVEDAVEVVEEIRVEYAAKIGEEALENLEHCLREAAAKLDLDYLPQLWAEAKDS